MMIMGLYLLGDVPFTDSFIHANIQDGKGERMSKSKGNGIDPEDIIEKYGTDAMRYVLCDMQTGTQDIRLPVQAVSPYTGELVDLAAAKHGRSIFTYIDPKAGKEFDVLGTMPDIPPAKIISERFEIGRAFCTKLWNAARFMFGNLGEHAVRARSPAEPTGARGPLDPVAAVQGHPRGDGRAARPTIPRPPSARPATSSGATSATGTSRSSSRACGTRRRRPSPAPSWPWPSTRSCGSSTPSSRSSPKSCGSG